MAKSIRNVMSSIRAEDQIEGMTEKEIRREFMLAGYGVTKAAKRVNELKVGAFIQTDGTRRDGDLVFWCIWWPFGYQHCDYDRVSAVEYEDDRHTILKRVDGKRGAQWINQPATE